MGLFSRNTTGTVGTAAPKGTPPGKGLPVKGPVTGTVAPSRPPQSKRTA